MVAAFVDWNGNVTNKSVSVTACRVLLQTSLNGLVRKPVLAGRRMNR